MACGRYPAKAVVGEVITVSATVFREGHDAVAANVRRPPAATGDLTDGGTDPTPGCGPLNLMTRQASWSSTFETTVVPDRQGLWTLEVQAWSDPLSTWRHAVEVKEAAGQTGSELANDLEIGARLLERVIDRPDSVTPGPSGRPSTRCGTPTGRSPNASGRPWLPNSGRR